MKYEQIADYAWLGKGRKYWTIRLGNPYVLATYRAPVTVPRGLILMDVEIMQAAERVRFEKLFPDQPWVRIPGELGA